MLNKFEVACVCGIERLYLLLLKEGGKKEETKPKPKEPTKQTKYPVTQPATTPPTTQMTTPSTTQPTPEPTDGYDEDYYGGDAYSEEPSYTYEPKSRPTYKQIHDYRRKTMGSERLYES